LGAVSSAHPKLVQSRIAFFLAKFQKLPIFLEKNGRIGVLFGGFLVANF
jgi:hypothetical protein